MTSAGAGSPAPEFEQRIGARRAVHYVTMQLPGITMRGAGASASDRAQRTWRLRPLEADVANLSLTGAGLVAPAHPSLFVTAEVEAVLDGCTGAVRVRRVLPDEDPALRRYGVSFVGDSLVPTAARLLAIPGGYGELADALVQLLDELAGWIERTATWSEERLTLRKMAWDLNRVVERLEHSNVGIRDIIASVCWIDGSPAGVAELDDLDQWSQDVVAEISRHPFEARQDLARALYTLASEEPVSPFGFQVMRALADSLL